MKAVLASLTLGMVTVLSSTPALADLLIYEPFDYASGSAIIGSQDVYSPGSPTWARAGTVGTASVHQTINGSLVAPSGFPASVGNAGVTIGGGTSGDWKEYARLSLGTEYGANSTTYYSLLLNVPSTTGLTIAHSNANANNDGIIAFNNTAGAAAIEASVWGGELVIRLGSVANTYNLGIRASTTAASTTYWSGDLTPGSTHLVVASYAIGASPGTGGVSSLWLDPTSFGGAAPSPDGTTVGDIGTTLNDHVDSLLLGAGIATGTAPNQTYVDEIRAGNTWADVTAIAAPEPSTLGLAGFGALALFSSYRARRR